MSVVEGIDHDQELPGIFAYRSGCFHKEIVFLPNWRYLQGITAGSPFGSTIRQLAQITRQL